MLIDRYRCIGDDLAQFAVAQPLSKEAGFFHFGPDAVCYGQSTIATPDLRPSGALEDLLPNIQCADSLVCLPFDPEQIVENLRRERYAIDANHLGSPASKSYFRDVYYKIRPLLGTSLRKYLQRLYLSDWKSIPFPKWPVDHSVETILERLLSLSMKARGIERQPFIWFWPDGAPSCTIMTHDVESSVGLAACAELMNLNDSYGIKSSFQIVPEQRYPLTPFAIKEIQNRGFEVNVHDLNHDGRLWADRNEFSRRVQRINDYGRQFGALGFRSAIMYRNPEWFDALEFSYDMSIPNVAHLDPQRGGCCTVMPYSIGRILELPLTTTQDYTLFNIFNDYSIDKWQQQMSIIRSKHGLMSFLVHPDYVLDPKSRGVYEDLLRQLARLKANHETWVALPKEVAAWWQMRSQMHLERTPGGWQVSGPGSDRARVAYAVLSEDGITYEV